ncbi:MAG: peptidoglycan-associated lipoprotein Pal [Aeromonadales bacterium]|nr:peptidoglycan-associated lipoprotein Pal [Aeromonadales bacterium]
MFKNYLLALVCALSLGTLTACTSSGKDDSSALVEDGGDVALGLDSDGALTVGDPNSSDFFNGPAELQSNNTIYFGYNSENIQDQYLGVMQQHADYLKKNPDARVIIEGHTDERGTPEYNIALGERRARSVARYMQNLGVDVNQLSIVSYGEEKPAVEGHSENAWSKNRRAVLNY